MNYFKLAVVLVRTWAAVGLSLAAIGFVWYSVAALKGLAAFVPSPAHTLAGSLWHLLAGAGLFLLSRPIAGLLSKALDENSP